jgi:hypothetical protein
MARAPEEMDEVLLEYAKVITRMRRAEMVETGDDREELGMVAAGIAGFLRRQPWRDELERKKGFALAAAADDVSRKCRATSHPRGQA